MDSFILDASVLLKIVINEEPQKDIALSIIEAYVNDKILIIEPFLWNYEVLNILGRKFSPDTANQLYKKVKNLEFTESHLDEKEINLALIFVDKYPKISFYDACYHTLAKTKNATFITADEKYYNITSKEGSILILDDFSKLAKSY